MQNPRVSRGPFRSVRGQSPLASRELQPIECIFMYEPAQILEHVRNAEITRTAAEEAAAALAREQFEVCAYSELTGRLNLQRLDFEGGGAVLVGPRRTTFANVSAEVRPEDQEKLKNARTARVDAGDDDFGDFTEPLSLDDALVCLRPEDAPWTAYYLGVLSGFAETVAFPRVSESSA